MLKQGFFKALRYHIVDLVLHVLVSTRILSWHFAQDYGTQCFGLDSFTYIVLD